MANANAKKILEIYAFFDGEEGDILIANQFLAIGGRRNWNAAELQDGIDEAYRSGWIEPGTRGWRLTASGAAEFENSLSF